MPGARPRTWLAAAFAVASGLALAWMDSSPGFDAVGLTVGGLVIAALVAVVIAGSRSLVLAAALGVVVGVWIPIVEVGGSGGAAALVAVAFALAGSLAGAVVVRGLQAATTA